MNQPKILPPTLRSAKRYIVFEIISEKPVDFDGFAASFWNSCLSFMGEEGMSKSRPWIIMNLYDAKRQTGVVRCDNIMTERVRTSLALINIVAETKSVIRVLGITGTIRSATEKYLVDSNGLQGATKEGQGQPAGEEDRGREIRNPASDNNPGRQADNNKEFF